MSKIILQSSNTGTGNITINAPVTNTDRTFVLPDDSGSILTTSGGTMTGPLAGFSSTGIDDNATATALTIDSAGRVRMPYQPAFAIQKGNDNRPSASTAILFATTQFDVGSNYNATNGRFTAPVAGKYMFSFSGITHLVSNYLYVYFAINGVNQDYTAVHLPSSVGEYDFLSMSNILSLNIGDYVTVTQGYNGGTPYFEGTRSSFSGHLIG